MTIVNTKERDWYSLVLKPQLRAMVSTIEVDALSSSIKKSIPRNWLPTIFTEDKEPLPLKSVDNKRGFDSSNQLVNGWLSLVSEQLYSNPAVEDIFVDIEDTEVDVWVVIPEHDLAILHQIVETEGELFDILVSGENPPFLMDFHIIYRCGHNVEELAPTRAMRLPR